MWQLGFLETVFILTCSLFLGRELLFELAFNAQLMLKTLPNVYESLLHIFMSSTMFIWRGVLHFDAHTLAQWAQLIFETQMLRDKLKSLWKTLASTYYVFLLGIYRLRYEFWFLFFSYDLSVVLANTVSHQRVIHAILASTTASKVWAHKRLTHLSWGATWFHIANPILEVITTTLKYNVGLKKQLFNITEISVYASSYRCNTFDISLVHHL